MIKAFWPNISLEVKQKFPCFAATYEKIKATGLPNFLKARIPVDSNIKIQVWKRLLKGYHDYEVCTFLEFGWPIGFYATKPPVTTLKNHPSATQHPQHIQKYLKVELSHEALIGPFAQPPFTPWTRSSPLMTRSKKDSLERRVIVDLSYPHGEAVNDRIDTQDFFGRDISYSLPTVGDLLARIQQQGRGAYIWKADLERAYRQLRVDPLDVPLLAVTSQDNIYLDMCPLFGCRSSSAACQ